MSKLIIRGGKPLSGHHIVPGNKNASLPMLAATLLADGPVTLTNLPNIADVRVMADGLVALGAKVTGSIAEHTLTVDPRRLRADPVLPADICTRIRTSFLFVGPLLARKGRIRLRGAPGGDSIGRRRLDTHVNGFTALGAKVTLRKTGSATALAPKGLLGTDFMLDEASVMGTENLVMAAVLAKGRTVLYNTACEPHVQNLCAMLNQMGAKIEGIGTNRLVIEGVQRLSGGTFRVGGDAIEAASYLIAAAATRGSITLQGVSQADMAVLQPAFRKLGVRWVWEDEETLRLPPRQRLRTAYDLGAAIPFESRLYFVDHLIGMGAKIVQCDPHRAVVTGPTALQGGTVTSPDIRAGMALIIAALCAKGRTVIHNADSIDRGYEAVDANLRALGADIVREP